LEAEIMKHEILASTGVPPADKTMTCFRDPATRKTRWALTLGITAAVAMVAAHKSQAATLYWDGGASPSTLWTTASNWDTAAGGGGGNPGAAPGASDVATFNVSTLNAATIATLSGSLSVQGMVFNNTGSTAINTDGLANRTITLGTSGLTLNAGAGTVTFGTITNSQRITFALGGSQSWTNNSSNTLAMLPNNVGTSLNLGSNTLTFAGSGNITTGKGIVSGSGGSIIKNGAGSLTLGTSDAGAQTFTGGVTLNAGTLTLGAATALGTGALSINGGTIDVLVSNTTPNNNTQNWNGDFTFAGTNTWNTGTGAVTMNASRQVTVNASTMTVGGVIGESASGFGLTKAGAGTLALNGANTFTGTTTVKAGTLLLGAAGSISNALVLGDSVGATSGTLNVTSKASFSQSNVSGNGLLNIGAGKTITVNGLAPGFSIGKIDVTGNLTLSGSSVMELAGTGGVAGTDHDNSTISGILTYGGLLSIASFGGFNIDGQTATYSLFDFTSQSGTLSGVTVGSTPLSYNSGENRWTATNGPASYSFSMASGDLSVVVVPEPGTLALAGVSIGMCYLTLWKRRRRV
jgi:autotransporter-associated beta strand protein